MFCSSKEEKDTDRTIVALLNVGISHWFYGDGTTIRHEIYLIHYGKESCPIG